MPSTPPRATRPCVGLHLPHTTTKNATLTCAIAHLNCIQDFLNSLSREYGVSDRRLLAEGGEGGGNGRLALYLPSEVRRSRMFETAGEVCDILRRQPSTCALSSCSCSVTRSSQRRSRSRLPLHRLDQVRLRAPLHGPSQATSECRLRLRSRSRPRRRFATSWLRAGHGQRNV